MHTIDFCSISPRRNPVSLTIIAQSLGRRPRQPTNLFLIVDFSSGPEEWNQTCSWGGERGQPLSRVYSQVSAMVEQTLASPCFLLLTDVSLHGQTTSVCPSVADGHTGCLQLLETIHNAIVHSVHGNALLSVASCLSLAANGTAVRFPQIRGGHAQPSTDTTQSRVWPPLGLCGQAPPTQAYGFC